MSDPARPLVRLALVRSLPLLLLCFALAAHGAQDASVLSADELQAKLAGLRATIAEFTRQLDASKSERTQLENELRKAETEIGELLKRIERIERDLRERRRSLARLGARQRELVAARAEQQEYIARQVRAAYKIGRQEYLKVLLNQEDPSQLSRMLKYYDYFNRARAAQVARYNSTLESLQQVEQQIGQETAVLQADQAQLRERRDALRGTQRTREATLALLNNAIEDQDAEIRRLATDRDRLEELLERIRLSIVELPTPGSAVPFTQRRGAMPFPVQGRITHRFGSPNKGKARWNGVFIETTAGEPVHAIHYGRIVFSDWLRGFGLLVIIDHGDGFMSLYGHNQTIYRETGEWVQAGDVIASAGNSGGQERTGLYFEIRAGGKPTDPLPWCLARSP